MEDDDEFDVDGTRRTRWLGLVGVSTVRLWKRTLETRSGRLFATVGAVALTVALMLLVTGVALSLAVGGAVDDTDADVRVAPESGSTLSTVDGVEKPRLGETTDRSAAIRSSDGVEHASPMLTEPVQLEPEGGGEGRRILLVGVEPDGEPRTVSGLSTDELEPAVPDDANGSIDDSRADAANASADEFDNATYYEPQGGIVLSTTAADRLGVEAGDTLAVGDAHLPADAPAPTVTVTAVESVEEDDGTPVALVHLTDLRMLASAGQGQLADEVLVWGEPDAAAEAAAAEYPNADVESAERTDPTALFDDGLAFATTVLSLVVGVAICASFVATTTAMTVNDDRRMLAVLASVGFPTRSRLTIVAVSTLLTTLCGALVGAALGALGIRAVNAVASATVAPGAVAQFHPLFVPYAVVVALAAGLIAVPYPLAVAVRTPVLREVGR